jgi:mono/diheme cytochrome c family protein
LGYPSWIAGNVRRFECLSAYGSPFGHERVGRRRLLDRGQRGSPAGAHNREVHAIAHAAALAAMLAVVPASRAAHAADPGRGAALYELRCGGCHSESVHGRKKLAARDFSEIRGWVVRWSENLKLAWSVEEIDDVSVYLNNTYYRYPCPPQVCKVVSLAPALTPPSRRGPPRPP